MYLFLVDQDVVVPLILGGARRPRAPEAEGDAHVGERDDGQRHEVLHDQQRNAEGKIVRTIYVNGTTGVD